MKKKETFTQGLTKILVKNRVFSSDEALAMQEMFKDSINMVMILFNAYPFFEFRNYIL